MRLLLIIAVLGGGVAQARGLYFHVSQSDGALKDTLERADVQRCDQALLDREAAVGEVVACQGNAKGALLAEVVGGVQRLAWFEPDGKLRWQVPIDGKILFAGPKALVVAVGVGFRYLRFSEADGKIAERIDFLAESKPPAGYSLSDRTGCTPTQPWRRSASGLFAVTCLVLD
jgi:hypothetical protein